MQARAQTGACLATLVKMALVLLKAAARDCARTGPGRPTFFEDWQIGALIFIAVLNRLKSKSAQYRFLHERQLLLKCLLDLPAFPARSTYCARYRQAYRLFQKAVCLQGRKAIFEGIANPEIVTVDKSLIAAKGRPWHRRRRRPVELSPGVDKDAGWSYSRHDRWVWGYSFETVLSVAENGAFFPILASAAPANTSEHNSFKDKIPQLPRSTRYVLADAGYDSNSLQTAIEYDSKGRPNGRHFLCPLVRRGDKPKVGEYPQRGERGILLARRRRRLEFFNSPEGRRIYKLRSRTIEPFHEWFKSCFELTDRVWHRGLENNQTQLLAAIFCYQLLVRFNYKNGNHNAQIQPILDRL